LATDGIIQSLISPRCDYSFALHFKTKKYTFYETFNFQRTTYCKCIIYEFNSAAANDSTRNDQKTKTVEVNGVKNCLSETTPDKIDREVL